MLHETNSGNDLPRVIIFSESGPLAGDLGACLAGRFAVERVTSLSGAGTALDRPSAALLVVPGRRDRVGSEYISLFRRAVAGGCRVLLLGGHHAEIDEDLKEKIVELPQLPSPALLFEGLSGLPMVNQIRQARQAEEG